MRTPVTQNTQTATQASQTSVPFFNKGGSGSFFSSSQENETPFFNTHSIQRSPSTDVIQRTCEHDPSVGNSLGLSCNVASTPNPAGTEAVSYEIEGSDISEADRNSLTNFVDNWRASGATDQLHVNGYASCDGPESFNWQLSCDRANSLAQELIAQGVDSSRVTIFANGETDQFSSTNLSANRTATIGFASTPGPGPSPSPTPTPTPTPTPSGPTVVPCSSFPKEIFRRGACGGGTDFTHNDFPALPGASAAERALVWQADNLSTDFRLRNDMRVELGILAGSEGWRMVSHFAGGTGSKLTHNSASTLGTDALASATFTNLHSAAVTEVESQLAAMHSAGTIDCNALSLPAASVPAVSFGFSDGHALKGIIGGTQGLKVKVTSFGVIPGTRRYNVGLQYIICDDFGVDGSDLYSPGLAAFWVLQHRRSGNLPFINELDLPKSETGTY